MESAIQEAYIKKILIFAAASNFGNSRFITFPARIREVICVFSTDGNVLPLTGFNPTVLGQAQGFAILGEEVSAGVRESGEEVRDSGTSIATSIATGIAGRMIDFTRQQDPQRPISQKALDKVKTYSGMTAVFNLMAHGAIEGRYKCLSPYKLVESFPEWTKDNAERRRWLREKLVWEAAQANKG